MHSVSLSFLLLLTLSFSFNLPFFNGLFAPFIIPGARAAITAPVSRNGDYIEQNERGTWCFYPKALDPTNIDVACAGTEKGDFASVMAAQLNRTTSLNYFSASLQRLGGPEWVVNATARKIYFCMSGRAGDYTYQTMCTTVGKDNSMGAGGPSPWCKVAVGQSRVTDGCYVPNQPVPSLTVPSTTRPVVMTVTRTSSGVNSGVTGTSAASTIVASSAATTSFEPRLGTAFAAAVSALVIALASMILV